MLVKDPIIRKASGADAVCFRSMRRTLLAVSFLMPLAPLGAQTVAPVIPPFSANAAGDALPAGWSSVRLNSRKTLTHYDLVNDGGVVVLHAVANASASVVGREIFGDLRATPVAQWRWKTARLIPDADNRVAAREDSPTRLIFEFDGDKKSLPLADRTVFAISHFASGRELPYATLMYIWSNTLPVNELVTDPLTTRVKMIVVSSGAAHLGEWQLISRNVVEDFQRAFGEPPGRLLALGVMTDTDNTGATAESWYGDIRLLPLSH